MSDDFFGIDDEEGARKLLGETLAGQDKWLRVFAHFLVRIPADAEIEYHPDGIEFRYPEGVLDTSGYGYEDIDCVIRADPIAEHIRFGDDERFMKVLDDSGDRSEHVPLADARKRHAEEHRRLDFGVDWTIDKAAVDRDFREIMKGRDIFNTEECKTALRKEIDGIIAKHTSIVVY